MTSLYHLFLSRRQLGSSLPKSERALVRALVCIKNPSQEILDHVSTALRYTNPAYVSAIRFGSKFAKKPDQWLRAYVHDQDNNYLWVPRAWFFTTYPEIPWESHTVSVPAQSLPPLKLSPLPLQQDALNAFLSLVSNNKACGKPTDAFIVLPPSSGKTVLGMLIAQTLKQKTLVVVPTKEIESAWVNDAAKAFGIPEKSIGIIRGQKIDTTKDLTVGSVQTLMKLDPALWADSFGFTVFDECHRIPGEHYGNVVKRCRSDVRLGMTATDYRRDGRFTLFRWHMGDPVFKTEERQNSVPLLYHPVLTPFGLTRTLPTVMFGAKGKTEEFTYNDLLVDLQNNPSRNEGIVKLTLKILREFPGDILVVSPRTEHLHLLLQELHRAGGITAALITGTTPKRKELFREICQGKYRVTLATTSIMSEGASNPRWHHVINTMPFSDKKTAVQLSGRPIRKEEGKKEGHFWDIVDTNPMARAMNKNRWNALKKFLKACLPYTMSDKPVTITQGTNK